MLDTLWVMLFGWFMPDMQCIPEVPIPLRVSLHEAVPLYDNLRSITQLEVLSSDTISPYGPGVRTHVAGLTHGKVSLSLTIKDKPRISQARNQACVELDSVDLKIDYEPTVYVASDFASSSCMYREVRAHEMKHVAVDQQVLQEYREHIAQGLRNTLQKLSSRLGPISVAQLEQHRKAVHTTLNTVMQRYSDSIAAERRKRQQAVDSLQEYERVRKSCAGKR